MKNILISIRPQYVSMILNKTKTIEVRKRFPKDYRGWVYIYCTKGKNIDETLIENTSHVFDRFFLNNAFPRIHNIEKFPHLRTLNGKVVARFYCDNVEEISYNYRSDFTSVYTDTLDTEDLEKQSCLTRFEFAEYLQGNYGYAVHISQLEIFDKPKELGDFVATKYGKPIWRPVTKAPSNYIYVEVEE